MRLAALALFSLPLLAAPDADGYFEIGVDYLKKGFYRHARQAFAESLVRAPGQPVTLAFLGAAATAEGRDAATCARLLRLAWEQLPEGKSLRLDLRTLLPSPEALALVESRRARDLKAARGAARRDLLTVLAFLQVHDGTPGEAPALDALLEENPKDPFGARLRAAGSGLREAAG